MNPERGINHASGKDAYQRVMVIRWSGQVSTKTCNEKARCKEKYTRPIVPEKSFVRSCGSEQSKTTAKYQCLFCDKSFKWQSHWKAHERVHTGEKPFVCMICGKAFARSDGLQCHKITHISKHTSDFNQEPEGHRERKANVVRYAHSTREPAENNPKRVSKREHELEKLFNCHHCSRIFFSSAGMVKHMQTHKAKGSTDYICKVCGMIFPKESALDIHSRVHTGVKPHQCETCTKSFSIYGNLKRHVLIHTGERPYKCSKCSNNFNNPSHLTRHLQKKHAHESQT